MADKVLKSVRLPADVAESVEQYADQQGISESDAIRRLVEQGIRGDRSDQVADEIDELGEEIAGLGDRIDEIAEHVRRPWYKRWL